jgi:tRNA-dihydrouridine synthase
VACAGYNDDQNVAHTLIPQLRGWGAAAVTLHGRSRQQRYTRCADWAYIEECAGVAAASGLPLIGNGDVFAFKDWQEHLASGNVATCMVARAALIKPWIFTGGCCWGVVLPPNGRGGDSKVAGGVVTCRSPSPPLPKGTASAGL